MGGNKMFSFCVRWFPFQLEQWIHIDSIFSIQKLRSLLSKSTFPFSSFLQFVFNCNAKMAYLPLNTEHLGFIQSLTSLLAFLFHPHKILSVIQCTFGEAALIERWLTSRWDFKENKSLIYWNVSYSMGPIVQVYHFQQPYTDIPQRMTTTEPNSCC